MNKIKKAFTLIELLIVIFIIALIVALLIFSISDSRSRGRDNKRINDITQIQLALENYFKAEGSYPESLTSGESLIGPKTGIVFMSEIPKNYPYQDFDCFSNNYEYYYNEEIESYELLFCLESGAEGYEPGIKCAVSSGILNSTCSLECEVSFSWQEHTPAGDIDQNWSKPSMTPDKKNILVGSRGSGSSYGTGRLWHYSGASWSEVRPAGNIDRDWLTTAMSGDGSKMVAASYSGGSVYVSSDSGNSWSVISGIGSRNWFTVSVSADGNTVIAGAYNDRIFLSSDGGVSWDEIQPAGNTNKYWLESKISHDGEKIILLTNEYIYSSQDSGSSWSTISVHRPWNSLAVTPDFNTILAGEWNGRLWLSNDTGQNWTEVRPAGDVNRIWSLTNVISDDGSKMLAASRANNAGIYYSNDSGDTWTEVSPEEVASSKDWFGAAMSPDGKNVFISGRVSSRLYYGTANIVCSY
jgi:prepilin-type N-terminal cleavage/methylation domain-containing protein